MMPDRRRRRPVAIERMGKEEKRRKMLPIFSIESSQGDRLPEILISINELLPRVIAFDGGGGGGFVLPKCFHCVLPLRRQLMN